MSVFNFTSTNPLGNYAVKVGNSKHYQLRALRSDGTTPINLTGASFRFTLRSLPNEAKAQKVKATGTAYVNPDPTTFTVQAAATGDFTLNLAPADTKDLAPATLKYDVELTEANGDVSTILEGDFELADHAARGN